MLQPIVKAQEAYFKDTFELKGDLDKRGVGWMYSLLTCDAVSMYTNIDTEDCISRLSTFLLDTETQAKFPHYNPKALIAAIKIVIRNNIMKFGDIFCQTTDWNCDGNEPSAYYCESLCCHPRESQNNWEV